MEYRSQLFNCFNEMCKWNISEQAKLNKNDMMLLNAAL